MPHSLERVLPNAVLLVVAAAGCAPSGDDPDVGQAKQELTQLVVDQENPPVWPYNSSWCAISPTRHGQQFVPTYDNVAAATVYAGSSIAHTVPIRILDATTYAVLGTAETVFEPTVFPSTVTFDPPVPVVPGGLYILEVTQLHGNWRFHEYDAYPQGSLVTWCTTNLPIVHDDIGQYEDFIFTTYALVGAPTFEDVQDTVTETSTDPADGQMTGPNAQANAGHQQAFANMIAAAEALFETNQTAEGCAKLEAARRKVTGPNAWFAGETATALLEMLDSLSEEHGCA